MHRPGFYAHRFLDFCADRVFKKIPSREYCKEAPFPKSLFIYVPPPLMCHVARMGCHILTAFRVIQQRGTEWLIMITSHSSLEPSCVMQLKSVYVLVNEHARQSCIWVAIQFCLDIHAVTWISRQKSSWQLGWEGLAAYFGQ